MRKFIFLFLLFLLWTISLQAAWKSPTGHTGVGWDEGAKAYDENLSTSAYADSYDPETWTNFLELSISPPISCDKVRFGARWYWSTGQIDIDVYYEDDWHDVYQGTFTGMRNYPYGQLIEKSIPAGTKIVSKARVRFLTIEDEGDQANLYEFDFHEPVYHWKTPETAYGTDWEDPLYAINETLDEGAEFDIPPVGGSYLLYIGFNEYQLCRTVRFRLGAQGTESDITGVFISAYIDDEWVGISPNLYGFPKEQWWEIDLDITGKCLPKRVKEVRLSFSNDSDYYYRRVYVYEVDFNKMMGQVIVVNQ